MVHAPSLEFGVAALARGRDPRAAAHGIPHVSSAHSIPDIRLYLPSVRPGTRTRAAFAARGEIDFTDVAKAPGGPR